MIIKRNDITSFLEEHITKEQNNLLNTIKGLRIKYIVTLSVLAGISPEKIENFVPQFIKEYEYKNYAFVYYFCGLSQGMKLKYSTVLNEEIFNFIKTAKYEDQFNEKYLEKNVLNILKIVKFKLDDFT